MNVEQLSERLKLLRLGGMADALHLQAEDPNCAEIDFYERLSLLLAKEETHRSGRKLKSRMSYARLREPHARIEELDYKQGRGLQKSQILSLATCDWLLAKANIIIVGATGTGKTYLACALAQRACYEGFSSKYFKIGDLLRDLVIAKADGSYAKVTHSLARIDLLILDDWGLSPLGGEQRQILFDLIDDRHKVRSLIITSQLPLENWFEQIGDPTIADAIMDRIINASYKIKLQGPSLRPEKSPVDTGEATR